MIHTAHAPYPIPKRCNNNNYNFKRIDLLDHWWNSSSISLAKMKSARRVFKADTDDAATWCLICLTIRSKPVSQRYHNVIAELTTWFYNFITLIIIISVDMCLHSCILIKRLNQKSELITANIMRACTLLLLLSFC